MLSFDEIAEMLREVTESFPREFFKDLNGGVILINDVKEHAQSKSPGDLYVLGSYFYEPCGLGRYIHIYYGSFVKVYSRLGKREQKDELRRILSHEFTHHLESLAGERGLERKDEKRLSRYLTKE